MRIKLPVSPILGRFYRGPNRPEARATQGPGWNNMTIILEGKRVATAGILKVFCAVVMALGYTGCATNPSPHAVFQTWGHELAHVVCGRFHPQPGYNHTQAYRNVGSWDFSGCESGSYSFDVYLYDTYDALRASIGNDDRASQWAGGYQTTRHNGSEWRTEIHVLRPTTDY